MLEVLFGSGTSQSVQNIAPTRRAKSQGAENRESLSLASAGTLAARRTVATLPKPATPTDQQAIRNFQFDIRPKAATEINDLKEASRLPGHTEEEITQKIDVRRGAVAKPTK